MKLMVSGLICLKENNHEVRYQVWRGMVVYSEDGEAVGKLSALLYKDQVKCAFAILIDSLPDVPDYHFIPVEQILNTQWGCVNLKIKSTEIQNLPLWHADGL